MTSRGRDSVAETGTPASALYVIESAANGARLHFPPSLRIEQEVEKLEGELKALQAAHERCKFEISSSVSV